MKITLPYIEGRLVKRYKRFLADIVLNDGREITAHTANTGAMKGCSDPGSRVWVYDTQKPERKYRYSWDLVEDTESNLVGIHTGRANYLVKEALENHLVKALDGYQNIKLEAKYFDTGTRFDLLLSSHPTLQDCFLEVKNVTAKRSANVAMFPDAVSKRGQKHLLMLEDAVSRGFRAAMFYCVQRDDVSVFSSAREVDPDYCDALESALKNGVEVFAYSAKISPDEVTLVKPLEIELI